MDYANKTALVLGLGESGLAMARWLAHCGATVRVADTREKPERLSTLHHVLPAASFIGGAFSTALLNDIDLIALSPGLMPDTELREIIPEAKKRGIPLQSEIELFARALALWRKGKAYQPIIIAVTGTNGKTTVTRLAGQMCQQAGMRVRVAGNISPAVLDVWRTAVEQDDLPQAWVLELSSFQLWSTDSLQANAAAVLNVTQDHLDWHGTLSAYAAAKARVFSPQTIQVLNRDDPAVMAMANDKARVVRFGLDEPSLAGDFGVRLDRGMAWLTVAQADEETTKTRKAREAVTWHFQDMMPAGALRIRGQHNVSNALAALALCHSAGLPLAPLLHALREYRGEPHRVELVMNIVGVSYIDDSKGTNVGATVAAIRGLGSADRKNLVLIAGGDGKNQDFTPLASPIAQYVHTVLLIGRDAGRIRQVLRAVDVLLCDSLEEAVRKAAACAQEGDTVLLSPACASMDMFRDYAHRAGVFASTVREVALSRGEVVA
ncbi:MAG: UDP-N-acetylmuramoyl-L-alanine--D-glutamate ligase [Burkholderiaceae bacterium]|jgi:UDP-N-acetylmuramoylalanine--D-glutamate ligase|nr:UDP-N-acetylmuramoyl-L-alanine--D-glutamate ligase [Burkholderiaceae bacterium]